MNYWTCLRYRYIFHTIWHLWEFHDRINKGVKSHRFAYLTLLMSIDNFSNRKSVQITDVVQKSLSIRQCRIFFQSFLLFQSKKAKTLRFSNWTSLKEMCRFISFYVFIVLPIFQFKKHVGYELCFYTKKKCSCDLMPVKKRIISSHQLLWNMTDFVSFVGKTKQISLTRVSFAVRSPVRGSTFFFIYWRLESKYCFVDKKLLFVQVTNTKSYLRKNN